MFKKVTYFLMIHKYVSLIVFGVNLGWQDCVGFSQIQSHLNESDETCKEDCMDLLVAN